MAVFIWLNTRPRALNVLEYNIATKSKLYESLLGIQIRAEQKTPHS
jgi:hypothetical protein